MTDESVISIQKVIEAPARGLSRVAEPLCVNRAEAAALCGLSAEGFDDWVRRGIVPSPIEGTRRWFLPAIRAALAQAAGCKSSAENLSAYDQWKAKK